MTDRSRHRPTAIDLFAGCGGTTEGLRKAGYDVRAAVEIDELAAESYRANHGTVPIIRTDIRLVSAKFVARTAKIEKGTLFLLAGCPPCQGFSSLRTLNGRTSVRDPRNALLEDFLRFVRSLRPQNILFENVPLLATKRVFTEFKSTLRRLGYWVSAQVIDAADFGVPQRRRRLILLASAAGPIAFPSPLPGRKTVREVIGGLKKSGLSGDPLHDLRAQHSRRVVDLIRQIPHDGGSRTALVNQLPCHQECDGFYDIYGRMAWDEVAPTITGGCVNPSKGRFLHPSQNRAISLREAALLQSFPPKYKITLRGGKYVAALQIGNALPPELVRTLAVALSTRGASPDRAQQVQP